MTGFNNTIGRNLLPVETHLSVISLYVLSEKLKNIKEERINEKEIVIRLMKNAVIYVFFLLSLSNNFSNISFLIFYFK